MAEFQKVAKDALEKVKGSAKTSLERALQDGTTQMEHAQRMAKEAISDAVATAVKKSEAEKLEVMQYAREDKIKALEQFERVLNEKWEGAICESDQKNKNRISELESIVRRGEAQQQEEKESTDLVFDQLKNDTEKQIQSNIAEHKIKLSEILKARDNEVSHANFCWFTFS